MVECTVSLDYRAVSPMYGGKPQYADGREIEVEPGKSLRQGALRTALFGGPARLQSEPTAVTVPGRSWEIDGLGLRDKSWGPRYWQALTWYPLAPNGVQRRFRDDAFGN